MSIKKAYFYRKNSRFNHEWILGKRWNQV